jgi:hypothetical protein
MVRFENAVLVAVLSLCVACGERTEVRQTPLEPLGGVKLSGTLSVPLGAQRQVEMQLRIGGLAAGATYVLCLNAADAGSRTSQALGVLGLPGWPLGAFVSETADAESGTNPDATTEPQTVRKGYWDFAKIQADAQGVYESTLELPLPALDYRVRLLVKEPPARGSRSILQSETLLLRVDPFSSARYGVAGATLLATLAGLGVALRRRASARASSGAALADAHVHAPAVASLLDPASQSSAAPTIVAPHHDSSPETASVPDVPVLAPLPGTCPQSLVDRARAEGVFVHHKDFAWVEIHGRRKSFRPRQALVFRILCEQDPRCYGIPQEQIVKEWEAVYKVKRANPVRVLDIFRSREDEPGEFIERVPGSASVYRLRLTPRDDAACAAEEHLHPRAASG